MGHTAWSYDQIKEAYHTSRGTIAGVEKRFVLEGMEAALGRKKQENYYQKVTGEVEARLCAIACSTPPKGYSRWTMQMIAHELIRLEVVDYITDTTVCEVMKKQNQAVERGRMVHSGSRCRICSKDGGCSRCV